MTEQDTASAIQRALTALVGERLVLVRRAADMRGFHFGGPLSRLHTGVQHETNGALILHVQCPWRIEHGGTIWTGRSDLFEPPEGLDPVRDDWDWQMENLQCRRLTALLEEADSPDLVVREVDADAWGGARIVFAGGHRLVLFPDGTRSEDYRLFRPGTDEHFVVAGGRVEL